jgi:hypothetical protein
MRVRFAAPAIVVLLLASATAALGSGLPWKADFPPADRSPDTAGHAVMPVPPASTNLSGGFSSVDFLGQVRKQLDLGHLISLFPFSWGSATTETAKDRARFLGFSYERINATPLAGSYYYTGERYEGRRIYVAATDKKPDGVPDHIFLGDGGHYLAYAISGKPTVYAYLPYGVFNINETVRPGWPTTAPASWTCRMPHPMRSGETRAAPGAPSIHPWLHVAGRRPAPDMAVGPAARRRLPGACRRLRGGDRGQVRCALPHCRRRAGSRQLTRRGSI